MRIYRDVSSTGSLVKTNLFVARDRIDVFIGGHRGQSGHEEKATATSENEITHVVFVIFEHERDVIRSRFELKKELFGSEIVMLKNLKGRHWMVCIDIRRHDTFI